MMSYSKTGNAVRPTLRALTTIVGDTIMAWTKPIPVGTRFGSLKVTSLESIRGFNNRNMVGCRVVCDCGKRKVVPRCKLNNGTVTSCGCARGRGAKRIIHGYQSKDSTPEMRQVYGVWLTMKNRCYRKEVKGFEHYGGRGITVCKRWLNSFAAFVADMEPRPAGMSIERIDNDGNYTPRNCEWATHSRQMKNRRKFR